MHDLPAGDPLATAAVDAIRAGDLGALRDLLGAHPDLATAALVSRHAPGAAGAAGGGEAVEERRTLLHVATDWPGHHPQVAATIAALVAAGADVDARFATTRPGGHTETALHWAASCDDTEAIDALLDAGADIEAPGAVIAGGTPLDDAVAFRQWQAADLLVARGAHTELWHAAALGLLDRVEARLAAPTRPPPPPPGGAARGEAPDEVTIAFWSACHGGRRAAAELLLGHGADQDWVSSWDGHTPLDAARRAGAADLVAWLESRGARSNQPT